MQNQPFGLEWSAMATYTVEQDTYAGWRTGRNFGLFGLAAGAIAFASWAYLHGHMRGMAVLQPSDQIFLSGAQWIGGAFCLLMAICVLGSIQRSAKSRGTVTVDDVGVMRRIGRRTRILRWEEIEGFVVMGGGGITLISMDSKPRIEIPMFLDDYRACIAEIKAKGLRSLPSDRLRESIRSRPRTWKDWLLTFASILMFMNAFNPGPHALRIVSLCAWVTLCVISVQRDRNWRTRDWEEQLTATVFFSVCWLG